MLNAAPPPLMQGACAGCCGSAEDPSLTPKPVCIHAVAPSFWAWKDGEASLLVSCAALQPEVCFSQLHIVHCRGLTAATMVPLSNSM